MFKPCLAFRLGLLMTLALAATSAYAQPVPGSGPGSGAAPSSPISNLINSAVKNPKDRNTTEHDLKAAEAGLADADPRVRVEALRKLRSVDDPKADYLLIRALADPDTRVKVKAIDILGSRGNAQAVPMMCQLLFLRSTESVVKLHIAAALGRIGDTRGAQPLIEYLGESTDERSRGTAVYALGEIGDPSATDVLTTAASEDPSPTVRRLARESIQKIDGEIPSNHPLKTARQQQMIPTDQRLSKMRQLDQEMNQH
jgi:HEAT repeat protein